MKDITLTRRYRVSYKREIERAEQTWSECSEEDRIGMRETLTQGLEHLRLRLQSSTLDEAKRLMLLDRIAALYQRMAQ